MTNTSDPHPSRDQLSALSDGLLTGADVTAVESHVAACDACAATLGELGAGDDLISRLRSAVESDTSDTSPLTDLTEGIEEVRKFLDSSAFSGSQGRLGHYEILECLGQGGFGIVFRAFDDSLQRVVAVKVLAPALTTTSPPRKRFLREARLSAQVRHDHVVGIYAVEERPTPYLVMEYIRGETLQQRLDRIGPLEVPEVLRLGGQIARGLAAAHEQGLIHRDIKPGNILLEQGLEERVKISDFGLARAVDDAQLTQSGIIAGTPMFMAPEQARGESIDQRADLFSLGSVLYTMVCGRPPFRASNSVAVLKRVCDDTPRPIQELIPETPQWLCDIIARLQAKDPAERFQSAVEVADLLGKGPSQIEQHLATTSRDVPVRRPQAVGPDIRSGRRRRWVAAATVMCCLLGGLGLSEATGVTMLAATVARILTPDGTLVVETSDPGVRVTVAGDGGLVINGAGLEEIRLAPGSYRVTAEREGARVPLDRELVSISRGGREVVRVRIEASPSPPAMSVNSDSNAFVLVGGPGVKSRRFESLSEAVANANSGDTIEVQGNGPFLTDPIRITDCDLTIRAAEGSRPVIKLNPQKTSPLEPGDVAPIFLSEARLVLEGLELHRSANAETHEVWGGCFIISVGRELNLANCSFRSDSTEFVPHECIIADAPVSRIWNCEFVGAAELAVQFEQHAHDATFKNCLHLGRLVMHLGLVDTRTNKLHVELSHNTYVTYAQAIMLRGEPVSQTARDDAAITVDASGNVITAPIVLMMESVALFAPMVVDAESELTSRVRWNGQENLYRPAERYVTWINPPTAVSIPGPQTLADWRKLWNAVENGSVDESPRFQGGILQGRDPEEYQELTPDDFRLRPDSAGYRAGKDGKDLGADVDLVGPGAGYERWKKTPEYQQWLKDIEAPSNPVTRATKQDP